MELSPKVAELLDVAQKLIAEANASYKAVRLPCGSRALAFAIEAGLPPQMSYTFDETAKYTGVPVDSLREEYHAGRLRALKPKSARAYRIFVDDVDEWMGE